MSKGRPGKIHHFEHLLPKAKKLVILRGKHYHLLGLADTFLKELFNVIDIEAR